MAKCDYCGDEEELVRIPNPNFDGELYWNVCVTCEEVIKWQQQLSFGGYLASRDDAFSKEYGRKRVKEAQENLERIAREKKTAIMTAKIYKKPDGSYDSVSIEYTGKGDGNG
jgi:hypothetical protein